MAFTGSYVKEYMTQDMKVKTHTDDLKKKMAQRQQNNVQQLLKEIEDNMDENRD